jgi:hypothetical protein
LTAGTLAYVLLASPYLFRKGDVAGVAIRLASGENVHHSGYGLTCSRPAGYPPERADCRQVVEGHRLEFKRRLSNVAPCEANIDGKPVACALTTFVLNGSYVVVIDDWGLAPGEVTRLKLQNAANNYPGHEAGWLNFGLAAAVLLSLSVGVTAWRWVQGWTAKPFHPGLALIGAVLVTLPAAGAAWRVGLLMAGLVDQVTKRARPTTCRLLRRSCVRTRPAL